MLLRIPLRATLPRLPTAATRRTVATLSDLPPPPHPSTDGFDVVVCGGGLLGISTAYHVLHNAAKAGGRIPRVAVVEMGDPMMLTSSKSTGGIRNFYPQFSTMTRLANRSIDLLLSLHHAHASPFSLRRRGYIFLSSDAAKLSHYVDLADAARRNGSGDTRVHEGPGFDYAAYGNREDGIDVVRDPEVIARLVPGCAEDVKAMMHVRKAGYLDVYQLGKFLLNQSLATGNLTLLHGRVKDIHFTATPNGKTVDSVSVRDPTTGGTRILRAGSCVLASGPHLREIASRIGVKFPVINELHARVAIRDPLHVVPDTAAFTIWSDDIDLAFTPRERAKIADAHGRDPGAGYDHLLRTVKVPGIAGAHARPMVESEYGGNPAN
ncbi:hypothetical protein HDU96_008224, partial [Phlyctochytrium bullatum]